MGFNKVAIIPARSGSKGLPNKNILMLQDKPLIAYTIEAALKSEIFAKVIVSTDSLEYKYIAEQYGADVVMRDELLSSDTATSFMVVEDILHKYPGYDYFALLQPTSPFRNEQHIKQAAELFEKSGRTKFLVSVVESSKSSCLVRPIDEDMSLKYFDSDFSKYRRQNNKEYSPNGAIFLGKVDAYLTQKHFFGADSVAYIMNKKDSIDIDDKLDFEIAILLQTQKNKQKTLLNNINKRILEKKEAFRKVYEITLIGHSIFDYWNIKNLNGIPVNNLGILGISSEEYYTLVLEKNLIEHVGDKVVLLSGTNDIVIDGWNESYTIKWIDKIVQKLKLLNQNVRVYLLAVPPVLGRIDRNNITIQALNRALQEYVKKYNFLTWVSLSPSFYDPYGNLSKVYTYDGLHFTSIAYRQLEQDLSSLLK